MQGPFRSVATSADIIDRRRESAKGFILPLLIFRAKARKGQVTVARE
jgi:hypothetical protein